jgi:hypothetical protein
MDQNTTPIIDLDNITILPDNHADAHDEEVILDENTIILASGDTYSLIDMALLRDAAKRSGKSFEDVSVERDISISSIYKFFAMKSKSPSFYNVVMICDAYGVSVDQLCNLAAFRNRQTAPDALSDRITHLEDTVSRLSRLVEDQHKAITDLLHELRRISPAGHDDY